MYHILDFFIEDIMKHSTVNEVFSQAHDIAKKIKRCRILQSKFSKIQESNSDGAKKSKLRLQLPGATRWGSSLRCLEKLHYNKTNLKQLAISDVSETLDAPSRKKEKNKENEALNSVMSKKRSQILLDDEFWIKIAKLIAILKPIVLWLQKFQTNEANLSSVPEAFIEIENDFYDQFAKSSMPLLTRDEINSVLEICDSRKKMAVQPIHLAANILDPIFTIYPTTKV